MIFIFGVSQYQLSFNGYSLFAALNPDLLLHHPAQDSAASVAMVMRSRVQVKSSTLQLECLNWQLPP